MNHGHGAAEARVVLAGVAGSGKTTIGQLLAPRLGVAFVDADDYHPAANRARMARGEPLDDADRTAWLRALHDQLATFAQHATGFVLACSALRRRYRDELAADLPPLHWVHLRADHTTLQRRLQQRPGHFFPATLLASQEATWEDLVHGLVVDGTLPQDRIVRTIEQWLHGGGRTFTPG